MPIRRGRFAPQNTFLETIAQKFDHGNSNFVLGSAQEKNDYPIVYCSDGFCELTGFSRSDLMRRSCACNFLYGLESNQDDIQSIENALKSQKELKKEILFYKKNGSPFYCLLDIVPIKNEKGNVVLFLVSHKDVTKRKLSGEIIHDDDQATSNGGGKTASKSKLSRSRSRKFSRDVLLHLSRQYQQSSNPTKTTARRSVKRSRSFSFTSERLPQYKRESTKKSKFLFLHYSNEKGLWDWWVLVLTFYIAIMVPYNVAFSRHGKTKDLIIVDMVIELFFILDIVVHFRTTFVDNAGRIVYDQKAIAIHYLKGWFVLDFLAALPFEALYFVNQSWGFLVQLLKCGRLLRLFRVVRKLHRYTEYSTVLLTLLMLAFAMVAHWLACVWYVIGLEEVTEKSTISWLYQFGETIERPFVNFSLESGPDEGSAYVTSLYFTLTSMTTVGFGNVSANTNAEKAFAVIVMLIGALMHAAIFGNVAAIIQKLYANRVRYHSRANEIKQFIRVHHIDTDLSNRLEDYFHTTWSISGGVDTREILATFPTEIQSDVCMHLYKGLLELPLFSQAPRGLVRMLSLQVRPVYVGPGEYLLMRNDVVNCIYYIASGSMEVLQGESVAAILGKGDLFGEDISRKIPIRRSNGDVRALTYCDIYYITRDLLQEVLHLYPDFSYKFAEKLELTYDLGASERDIWRRGGLDSISEDEEEEENEEETSDSPETGSDANNMASKFPVRNRFTKRLNPFSPNESWRMYSRPQFQRHNRFGLNENQPLLNPPQDNLVPISGIKILQPSKRQISFDTKTMEQKDSEMCEEAVECDTNLEWEQETFTLKEEKEDEEENDELVDTQSNNHELASLRNSVESHASITDDDYEDCDRHNGPETSYRLAKESFLKHLRLGTEDHDHDEEMSYYPQNSINRSEHEDEPYRKSVENYDDDQTYNDREDLIGFTEFATPNRTPCSSRQLTRSPMLVSPTHSLNFRRSSKSQTARNKLRRDHSDSALLRSPTEGSRKEFDQKLPRFYSGDHERQAKYVRSSEALRAKPMNECSTSPKQSIHHDDNSRHSLCPSSTLDSPYVSIKRLFALTPPPRDDFVEYPSNEDVMCYGAPSRSESPSRFSDSGRSPRNSLRRNMTSSFTSPASSCGGLNEEKDRRPSSRRRKMSTANAPPPLIFASLVAQACKSPYADFVPPKIVRESTITCNCEEEESCEACGDKDSVGGTPNGNLSSNEELRDGYESCVMEDVGRRRKSGERLELSSTGKECSPDFVVNMNAKHEELNSQTCDVQNSIPIETTDRVNYQKDNVTPSYERRKRPLFTRDAAVYSSSSQVDELESLNTPIDSPCLLKKMFHTESECSTKEKDEYNVGDCATGSQYGEPRLSLGYDQRLDKNSEGTFPTAFKSEEATDIPPFFDEVFGKDKKNVGSLGHSNADSATNRLHIGTNSHSPSSMSSLSSPLSQSAGIHTSATDLSHCESSNSNLDIHFPEHYSESERSYHTRKPTISGIHSTHSLEGVPNPRRPADLNVRTMRNSYSEPHLQSPIRIFPRLENLDDGDMLSDLQLEDIFKDVVNTKQAMERLQMILSSPEPTMSSDLADTKETVKRLDQQVLHLNQDLASLRGDVKMVLELLKGLKNGQTVHP
ncbi:uncharacterized protein LOC116306713 isoform X2 [Actinia tenebrosa]|uniref:Uncharacterized protein LOC116306713 isoform X2 n=1 Tax=Actinia tenebrosa TaxID=6105 RepID=A0A6P8J5C1_ACTTE|nr:uncharacterized protein LOC116306713 isoform X2 [Actinia tenebrosa]